MKRFVFTLETLLKERSRAVEDTRKKMTPVINRYNHVLEMERRVRQSLSQNTISEENWKMSSDYLGELSEIYKHLGEEKQVATMDLQKWQETLTQKIKDKRVLEIIKEKRFTEWKNKMKKKMERDNEEMILQHF